MPPEAVHEPSFAEAMSMVEQATPAPATEPVLDPKAPPVVIPKEPEVKPEVKPETKPDEPELKPEEGPEKKKEGEEEPPAEPVIPEALKELFPESTDVVHSVKELQEKFQTQTDELKEADDTLDELYHIIDASPIIRKTLTLISGGTDAMSAMLEAMGMTPEEIEAGLPNPTEDPVRFREFSKRMAARELKLEEAKKDAEKRTVAVKKAETEALQLRTQFQKDQKLTDAGMKTFLEWVGYNMFYNPETGRLPKNFLPACYAAYTHDEDARTAAAKAKLEGRNEVLKTRLPATMRTPGDGIPAPHPGGGKPATPTEAEIMAQSFSHPARFAEDARQAK
jgi:hypothetical protein